MSSSNIQSSVPHVTSVGILKSPGKLGTVIGHCNPTTLGFQETCLFCMGSTSEETTWNDSAFSWKMFIIVSALNKFIHHAAGCVAFASGSLWAQKTHVPKDLRRPRRHVLSFDYAPVCKKEPGGGAVGCTISLEQKMPMDWNDIVPCGYQVVPHIVVYWPIHVHPCHISIHHVFFTPFLFFVFRILTTISEGKHVIHGSFRRSQNSKFDQLNGGAWAMGRLWACT